MKKINKNETLLQTGGGGGNRRPLLKLLLAIGLIAFATSITAVSCGKTAGGGGNNNTANTNTNSNSGGSGGNGGSGGGNTTCTGICPTTNLVLEPASSRPAYVKINGNTVTVNAAGLAGAITPHADANDNNRGYVDVPSAAEKYIFKINYPGASAIMPFVNRASISTNNITMPATSTTTCSSSETGDNTLATAAGGGTCRIYTAGGTEVNFRNHLGTVFNNTDTANRARGTMTCNISLKSSDAIATTDRVINDTITFNNPTGTSCLIDVINNAGTAAAAEIDDAWVGDTASTTEVELYAIGINVDGKTIPQFSSDAGYNLAEFVKAHDNAAFKRLLQTNPWGELKFKVKIVTAANF